MCDVRLCLEVWSLVMFRSVMSGYVQMCNVRLCSEV